MCQNWCLVPVRTSALFWGALPLRGVGSDQLLPWPLLQVEAAARFGAQQVLYTFNPRPGQPAGDDSLFAECGAMNIFFLLDQVSG